MLKELLVDLINIKWSIALGVISYGDGLTDMNNLIDKYDKKLKERNELNNEDVTQHEIVSCCE